MENFKLKIRGTKQVPSNVLTPEIDDITSLRESYAISGPNRGYVEDHMVDVHGEDLIELIFEDNTHWFCNTDTLHDVFPDAAKTNRSSSSVFEIPIFLTNPGAERDLVSGIVLKIVNIFTKKAIGNEVKKFAVELEKKQLDNYSGLYRLDASFHFHPFLSDSTNQPYLLFLHGTASSTKGSFGGLLNTDIWNYLLKTYEDNILTLQHETLTKSPLENVLDLVKQLPPNASLHIISHSRGGLVGDILSRFSNSDENNRGFDNNEINFLKKVNRTDDLEKIEELKKELNNRKIKVDKFIRVACPAGGTTLASKRLDNFFNITFNLIGYGTGIAANPMYIAFKNLLSAVVGSKNDINSLPGLEAMNPESPFIKVLNSPATHVALDSPLIVISGNCKIKLNLKALIIIASKLFYLKDNDLVVNTRSMYQGTKRLNPVQYYFDNTTDVDHFNYFNNKSTNTAILTALKSNGDKIDGFIRIEQDVLLESDRNALLNLEGGQVFTSTVTGSKPIVVLLPGIMGSNLTKSDRLLWINYLKFIAGELSDLYIQASDIKAPSIIRTSYKKLVNYLSTTYDVVTFPFDWRLKLDESADLFNEKIKELLAYQLPIKIIGHSMGGVLVRDFIIKYPDTWSLLNKSVSFRLLFLGSPLGGSFRIPCVLFGRDAIINKLSKIDIFNTKEDLLEKFSKLPGLLNLLPLSTDSDNDFASIETWNKMKRAFNSKEWPLPKSEDLDYFKNYRDNIIQNQNDIDYSNMIYIAGRDIDTPCGYRIDNTNHGEELVFLSTAEGDQSVTWDSGIPKTMIANNSVYYVNVTHGSLANNTGIFKGLAEILENGYTGLLSKTRPVVRSEEKVFETPDKHDFDLSPQGIERTLLGLDITEDANIVNETPIAVWVSNGDLRYASYPILAAHFLNDGILYAERVIDHHLEGALSDRHRLGLYPGDVGTSEILVCGEQDFQGAIIVGLGPFGSLTAFQLTRTIEQAISKYLLNLNSQVLNHYNIDDSASLGISSLIIGCGYGGLTVENSVRAILQGVQNANEKLLKLSIRNAKVIKNIEFIEQYEDISLGCYYSISRIQKEDNKSLNITVARHRIRTLLGARKRLPIDATEGWWNRITVQLEAQTSSSKLPCLLFNASTGGAREEQRRLYSSSAVLEQLIAEISSNNRWSPELAKTVWELMIPNDFKDQIKKHGNVNWILDKHTAAYPWELLQDNTGDAKPLCVNAGMIRQLATQNYRLKINPVVKNTGLVVGEPNLNGFLSQLPGALEEGKLVSNVLMENGYDVASRLNSSAPSIIQALFQDDYKIIHLAGHGVYDSNDPGRSGMVIGKNVYLSTREINQMSTVPEFVFVNCCYLGRTDVEAETYYQNLYKLAANIGTQLIENGVKAVVVAGWAVNDSAALDFAEAFYRSMFTGACFGDAVKNGRQLIYDKYKRNTNTWGAYQCYGDPFYKFKINFDENNSNVFDFVIAEQAEMELENLRNALDANNLTHEEYLNLFNAINEEIDKAGFINAAILQKQAFILSELFEYDLAIAKFETLLSIEKAAFSIATLERYCNIRAKKYVADYLKSQKTLKGLISKINKVIKDLESLLNMSPTAERYSLLGSTYKRKAILTADNSSKFKSYADAAYYYGRAYSMKSSIYAAYALTNWLELESILVLSGNRKWNDTIETNEEVYSLPSHEQAIEMLNKNKESIDASPDVMDYWNMVAIANIELCFLMIKPPKSEDDLSWSEIINLYRKLWNKAGSKGKKAAEIEHLELLIDAFTLIENQKMPRIKDVIIQLKNELNAMV